MGLDLIVESCAKPGHEAEWRSTMERSFRNGQMSEADIARFQEISIPPHERLDAPRVGYDAAADAWILETRKAATDEEKVRVLKDFHGYYVLRLVESDGLPEFTHAGLYDGVDETSFRGAFLEDCADVLSRDLIERAWEHKLPEAAIDYGRALLAAADAAEAAGPIPKPPPPKAGFLASLGFKKKESEPAAFDLQLRAVRSAGKWFVFWGERGHAVRAWS